MTENQISPDLGFIEIIQTVEIYKIITDTLWIYETLAHFFIRCQTKGPKNAAFRKSKGQIRGLGSTLR
jgi:hypothetical protein